MDKQEIEEIAHELNKEGVSELKKEEISLHVEEEESEEDLIKQKIHDEMRLGFIRKVYGIFSVQLLLTTALCFLTFIQSYREFFIEHMGMIHVCFVLQLIVIIPMLCFKSISRRVPINYILLFIFTFCEAYMVATVCAVYDPKTVILAALATTVVTISLTIYACTTKTDFTFCGSFLFSALACLILLGLFSFFIPFGQSLLAILGVFIYSLYLIYDTQLIIGKFGSEYEVDDYIIAALNIYIDVIQIFLYILQILAQLSNSN